MGFRVGQKVVFVGTWPKKSLWWEIKHAFLRWRHPYPDPVLNQIYTVSAIDMGEDDGQVCLSLIELPDDGFWLGYHAEAFRPAVDRKTDISVFTKMLTDTKVPA